ncbi:hypothetical protein [Actinoplanes solisilvae]|uniref:hypothetical protein n=1 Tax=Actinoplanes solisilvae TaxID=2486853 RepID=UPI000FDA3C96|nr:hypothetical protein [Actinoplanes solisilvae]
MEEQDFWVRLEYRISAEFTGFDDKQLRWFWCDGLIPEEYDLAGSAPSIRGRAWCGADGQDRWRFTLILAPGTGTRERIDWPALLPGDRLTGWLSPDPEARTMIIDPSSAYPD